MDFPFVLPYNKRNYRPQGKRRTTMLYPIMNRSRSLIDLGGVWQFQTKPTGKSEGPCQILQGVRPTLWLQIPLHRR